MDPTQCLLEILEMFAENNPKDKEDICDRLLNLIVWVQGNGFYPDMREILFYIVKR